MLETITSGDKLDYDWDIKDPYRISRMKTKWSKPNFDVDNPNHLPANLKPPSIVPQCLAPNGVPSRIFSYDGEVFYFHKLENIFYNVKRVEDLTPEHRRQVLQEYEASDDRSNKQLNDLLRAQKLEDQRIDEAKGIGEPVISNPEPVISNPEPVISNMEPGLQPDDRNRYNSVAPDEMRQAHRMFDQEQNGGGSSQFCSSAVTPYNGDSVIRRQPFEPRRNTQEASQQDKDQGKDQGKDQDKDQGKDQDKDQNKPRLVNEQFRRFPGSQIIPESAEKPAKRKAEGKVQRLACQALMKQQVQIQVYKNDRDDRARVERDEGAKTKVCIIHTDNSFDVESAKRQQDFGFDADASTIPGTDLVPLMQAQLAGYDYSDGYLGEFYYEVDWKIVTHEPLVNARVSRDIIPSSFR